MSLDISLRSGGECVYDANITHNLSPMARQVGSKFYKSVWRPEEIKASLAKEIVVVLTEGLVELLLHRDYYKQFNPDNGWGTYEQLCDFVYSYIKACNKYPDAIIEVDR